jgi:hypothetical protein
MNVNFRPRRRPGSFLPVMLTSAYVCDTIVDMAKKHSSTKTDQRTKVCIWFDDNVVKALREIDVEVGVTISEQIRRAVASYLRQQGKLFPTEKT